MSNILEKFKGRRVLVTGHTGFKGSWLSIWLKHLGAEVFGYALAAEEQSLFNVTDLSTQIHHFEGDVRNFEQLNNYIRSVEPEIIFHLAAQPLVRYSYDQPKETYEVNVMGTLNVLECVRHLDRELTVICVTTDKSYDNKEWIWGYRENDAMGGHDPYSSSKGCCELLIDSYNKSYFLGDNGARVKLASVRAGNVIGGGDWAKDRIVPDCIAALAGDQEILVRNPYATRPWQHVLEPLGGYLLLGIKLLTQETNVDRLTGAFNFGPSIASNRSVGELVDNIVSQWGTGVWINGFEGDAPHEANLLNLTIDKAFHLLNWLPVWDFDETVKRTVSWYKNYQKSETLILCKEQILDYQYSFYQNYKKQINQYGTPAHPAE